MEEVAISVLAKVSEYLIAPAIRTGSYLFCVGKLTKKLENEKRKLTATKDDVSQRAEEAKRKTERIETVVEMWLQEVQILLQEVENKEKEVRANSYCFWNLCPPWRRYSFCKQLAEMVEKMIELNKNSTFERFSRLASLPTHVEYFSSNFMLFESTKLAYDQLLEAMKDDSCYMICLHGMGGCGKTTLAKEVGKRAKELNLFDKVVFTTVSQNLDVRRIQGDIADELGISPLIEEGEDGRARRLSLRLQSGEKILVILDDVWRMLNLQNFGISLDGNLKGCKVLLTTRLQQLCSLMDGQRNVQLQVLSTEEAWAFFQKKACITEDSSSINIVAREIAAECKGLPIAIQAVATTSKGKPLHSWKDALYKLRHSKPVGVPEGVVDAFTCFQYSYDALTDQEAKRLFLMCSIFPEDHEMEREDLFRYGVGLGLFGEDDSFDYLRNRVNAILTNLLDYSLLMHCERGEDYFQIHDVVRDFAVWKSSEMDWSVIVDHAKGINSLALDGVVKNCSAISTWCNRKDDQFPPQLDSPKLEILLLNSNNSLDLSQASFEGIEGLKVMALINPSFYIKNTMTLPMNPSFYFKKTISLPKSTQGLTNLRTLCLVRCKLGDISFVVFLKRLEILDLHESKFKLLPKGIEELKKLKMLDLRLCSIIENFDEVIGRYSQLEELYVYGFETYFGKNISESHTCFLESASLSKLERYILQMGNIGGSFHFSYEISRVLCFGELNISTLSPCVKDLIRRAECFYLKELHGGCKSIFPEFVEVVGSMNQLIKLRLYRCWEIESFICSTPAQVYCFQVDMMFSMVDELWLCDMDNLKQVCRGPLPPNIFQNLKEVRIHNCRKLISIFPGECNLCNLTQLHISDCPLLTSLFPMSVAQTLSKLERIDIKKCSELRHIMMNEGHNDPDRGEEIFQASESSDFFMFPKLKHLSVYYCDKLEYVLRIPSAQAPASLLELLNVHYCNQLKYIVFNEEEDGGTTREQKVGVSENSPLAFPKLRYLYVQNCNQLGYILPAYCAQGFAQLQNILIANVSQMKYVFGKHVAQDTSIDQNEIQIVFPHLNDIVLENLTSLVKICPENCHPSLPCLKEIRCLNCPKLTNMGLHEAETAGCEVSNEVARIRDCGVINLFHLQGEGHRNDHQEATTINLKVVELVNLPQLTMIWRGVNFMQVLNLSYLESITLDQCGKLKCIFPSFIHISFPHLTGLFIKDCEELEEIFAENKELQNPHRVQERFPKLEELKVNRCAKLKVIFSVKMATSFPQLKTLWISEASELKEIFGSIDEDISNNEKKILVPNLREVTLEKLPSLVDICQGYNIEAEEPPKIQIHDCPKCVSISKAAC